MHTAVLFLVFNRPDPTRRVFDAIRAARPARLYVAADGPRADRAGEAERCAEVRAMATAVDWPCEVLTLFRDANLGCKRGVAEGIDWFFAHEAEGIILEDDVLPHPSFFAYCATLLERYRELPEISMISGCNLIGDRHGAETSYVFSRYLHVWGWASWRRAWLAYDVELRGWPSTAASAKLNAVLGGRTAAIDHWTEIFNRMARGEVDTWDYQWVFASWMHDMKAIIPAVTLVENIGFGKEATHTTGTAPAVAQVHAKAMTFPLRHPVIGSTMHVDILIEQVAIEIKPATFLRTVLRRWPALRRIANTMRHAAASR
jgi:hypothetical protein